jgi:aspartate 1-decarboxylase
VNRTFLYAKVHRAHVTEANLEYEGSLTLDQELMDAARLREYERIDVWNVTNGNRFSTYLINGPRGKGDCCINGAAAHLCRPGDRVIIAAFCDLAPAEVRDHHPRVVLVRGTTNLDFEVKTSEKAHTIA